MSERDLSVSYPTDRSLQHCEWFLRCEVADVLSVSYPTDRSLQPMSAFEDLLASVIDFQYPTLRIVLCNS